MKALTGEQRIALFKVYSREVESDCPTCKQRWRRPRTQSYLQFRRNRVVNLNGTLGCVMVQLDHITLGIEPDGYTHS